jgi:hypothetical protein
MVFFPFFFSLKFASSIKLFPFGVIATFATTLKEFYNFFIMFS